MVEGKGFDLLYTSNGRYLASTIVQNAAKHGATRSNTLPVRNTTTWAGESIACVNEHD
jgi:hypothetical protein